MTREQATELARQETKDNMKKTFVQLSRAWYGEMCLNSMRNKSPSITDVINIALETDESMEIAIEWKSLRPNGLPSPRIGAYSDSWKAFELVPDLFAQLVLYHGTDPTPKRICELLEGLGFIDATEESEND